MQNVRGDEWLSQETVSSIMDLPYELWHDLKVIQRGAQAVKDMMQPAQPDQREFE